MTTNTTAPNPLDEALTRLINRKYTMFFDSIN